MLHAAEPRTLRAPARATTLGLTDVTADASRLAGFDGHEQVWLGRDASRGLTAIVAIHDTSLGPALGGTRVWPHDSLEAALTDALRLSAGMSLKAAVAGLPFGGGKAVIVPDPQRGKTRPMLEAYAEMLAALDGQFFTAEDVGLTLQDADFLASRAPNVSGTTRGGSGNPSPVTARGVFLGLKCALRHRLGTERLDGVRVAVQGLGAVGFALSRELARDGAVLTVSDIDPARVAKAVDLLGATPVAGDSILAAEVDVLAPCALGAVLSAGTIPAIRAAVVAGAANNQLATPDDAHRLASRGVLYAPDFVINAGGLINVAQELSPRGYDAAAVMRRVDQIPGTLSAILRRAKAEGTPTGEVAAAMAMERIRAARR